MPDDAAVRPAEPGDAAAVEAVARASWHGAYDDLLGRETVERTVEEWYDRGDLAEAAESDAHAFYVADAGDDVVGFAHATAHPEDADDGVAVLVRLYVRPDRWNEGVGSALLARTERDLRERGFDRLRLHTFADNEVGVAFYERRGFEVVGERDGEFGGETYLEYVFEKDI